MTDGVFPTTGAIRPLPAYPGVLSRYSPCLLCIDDSHAVGVIGERGQGTFSYYGMKEKGFYFAGTLSKAFGGIGGIIPGTSLSRRKSVGTCKLPDGTSDPPPLPSLDSDGHCVEGCLVDWVYVLALDQAVRNHRSSEQTEPFSSSFRFK